MNIELRTALAGILTLALVGCGTVDGSRGMVTDVRVVINEFVAKNTIVDATTGTICDWVELYNPLSQAVDLKGFYLSDSVDEWYKYQIPSDVVIEPGGYLLFFDNCAGESTDPMAMPFGLGLYGDDVVFSAPEGVILDAVTYTTAMADQSYSRFPNGTGAFAWCGTRTPKADNGASCGATTK